MRSHPSILATLGLVAALASCSTGPATSQHGSRHSGGQGAGNVPPIPSARELAQDPAWIQCDIKARWVYLEDAPDGFRSADWIPLPPDYKYSNLAWLNSQPMRRFADGPGQLTLRKHHLQLGNVFKADNSLLEVTGDWRNGRLMRAVRIRGAGELAQVKYNWDAIGAGFAIGLGPFVWTGAKLAEAIKEGAASQGESGSGISGGESGQPSGGTGEVERFKSHFKGRDVSFIVMHDDGGGFASSNDLVLKDAATGKRFSVWFTYGLDASLGGGKSLEGRSVEIRFGNDGAPRSIKNLENGRSFNLDGWKASGYGW